jgi:Chaperone of endosialidase
MAYIGNQNYQAYVTLSNQTFTTSGSTTIYALNYTVTNANNIALYINNVAQQPGVAYTASGNTLTLTTATSSSMYAVYLGQGIQTVTPGATSVGTTQMNYPLGNFKSTGITDNASTTALTISSTAVALGTSVYVTNFKSTGITDNASATAVTVNSSGNVGIGISGQTYRFQIAYSGLADQLATFADSSTYTSNGGVVIVNRYNNTTDICGIKFSSQTATAGYITFHTGGTTEAMRIDSSGNLLVGYTGSNGSYKLQVNSQIFATSGTIATSDANYKTNVTPLSNALLVINKLNPVSFNWKKHPIHNFDIETPTVGFLAQEVQTALANENYVNSIVKKSNCVITPAVTDKDGNIITPAVTEDFLGIAEGNMIAILTKAIQELNTQVTQQQTIITQLQADVAALKTKVGI